jgi:hypothetical protein
MEVHATAVHLHDLVGQTMAVFTRAPGDTGASIVADVAAAVPPVSRPIRQGSSRSW